MMRLDGKSAMVTAAGQGIGAAVTRALAAVGADVLATDIDEGRLTSSSEVRRVRTAVFDVTDRDALDALQTGDLDILVHCAGMVHHGTLLDCDRVAFDRVMRLNVTAAVDLVRAVLPGMLRRSGSIILIGSTVSSIIGAPNRFAYGVSKAALVGLAKSLAVDFAAKELRCNVICPGTVDTPSLRDRIAAAADPAAAHSAFLARQPMGRLGTAAEIAAMAVYLASDEAAYVSGQTFVIDGGWTAA